MIAVMAMTPVHIDEAGAPDTLRIVGFVLSVHIAGMYALSPVTGWLTDRVGRRPVILGGIACWWRRALAGRRPPATTRRTQRRPVLLGHGLVGHLVAGSTLLTESVGVANRPSVQGLSDLVMGLAAASAGALSGLVVAWSSFGLLTRARRGGHVPLIALGCAPAASATQSFLISRRSDEVARRSDLQDEVELGPGADHASQTSARDGPAR